MNHTLPWPSVPLSRSRSQQLQEYLQVLVCLTLGQEMPWDLEGDGEHCQQTDTQIDPGSVDCRHHLAQTGPCYGPL